MKREYEVMFYERENGERPFLAWLGALGDARAALAVDRSLIRLRAGDVGDAMPVGEGVHELRVSCGIEARLYFCRLEERLVILLADGDRGDRQADIRRARAYRRDLVRRNG